MLGALAFGSGGSGLLALSAMAPEALTESVSYALDDGIAVVTIDNPPVNALSWHVRQGLADAMARSATDDAAGVVISCAGRTFIAGADISEFGQAPQGPSLAQVQEAMEDATRPVVAAIHGTALGGGLEVALCAHFRVAVPSARFGLPEVNLGLLPGAGGTQRLPRVTGAEKATQMVTTGDQIGTDEALACGLVDEVATSDDLEELQSVAIAFARQVAAAGRELVRIRDRDVAPVADGFFDDYRAKIARKTRGFLAPEYNIRCIEAAVTKPFDEGMAVERELFTELMKGPQSSAQRYYFFAERAANKVPDIPRDTPLIDIGSAGVLGAGTMGGGIAMCFANAGIPVTIVERDQDALDRGLGVIRANYQRRRGSTPDEVEGRMAMITGSIDQGDFADLDIVVEAVFENMDLKKEVFARLDEICKPGAILATNTSALDVNEIASATSRPESVIGLHFFSPANIMKLLEVVRGDASSDPVVATSMALGKRLGKVAVLSRVCRGFIGNRILAQRRIEADRLILEGVAPARVDKVLFEFGLPMGPFAMADLAGLDIGWNAETSNGATIRDRMCESGRRGQKNGRGYYIYDPETRSSTPDPEVEELIRAFAAEQGVEARDVSDTEILERCLFPMVNEGAKLLGEGIALRGSDIDVVWTNGYGWPKYRGGPMYWADSLGLDTVADKITAYGAELGGTHWDPAPLLVECVADGTKLQSATPLES